MVLRIIFFMLLLTCLLFSCKSDYEQLVERELASGERQDSIFFGIYLGMSADSFYKHCWQLNKTKLFKQGQTNTSVEYTMSELKAPAAMNFYPVFFKDEIHEMPVMFNYIAWAPWNKDLWSDSLMTDVLGLLERWHGKGFIKMKHPEKGIRYAKVDGNRRILVWKEDDMRVKALYTDLTVEKEMNDEKQAKAEAEKDSIQAASDE